MAELRTWRAIPNGKEGDEVILTVDFTVTGRPEAGFAELAGQIDTPHPLWEAVPPAVGDEKGMTGPEYVARWTDELRDGGVRVAAVFGYCASSVFALALADEIAAWQQRPKVVLFDPTAATGLTVLHYGFYRVVGALSAVLTPEEVEAAHQAGLRAQQEQDDLGLLCQEFIRIYQEVGTTAFDRVGLDAERAEELVGWFRSYLTYLVAAGQLTVSPAPASVEVIRSDELAQLADSLKIAAREVRFDIDHSGLLREPGVGRAVTELLS
ncbi:hypothetical protein ACFY12_31895 [Streptomyces sp. NPDC001339]|uniref:hypothetical protein n=1 Tax=Streptomyces sp. NPDC001339 TaxID=3364563 RepID=UPI0036839DBE